MKNGIRENPNYWRDGLQRHIFTLRDLIILLLYVFEINFLF